MSSNEPIQVVGCFLMYQGRFLIVKRADSVKHEPGVWGLPAGKVDEGEDEVVALVREVQEETGFNIEPSEIMKLHEGVYPISGRDINMIVYRQDVSMQPDVQLNPDEHSTYEWVSALECDAKPDLIEGFHTLLRDVGYID